MEDVSKIRAALEVLRVPHKKSPWGTSWAKNKFHTADGQRHCILGSLYYVTSGDKDSMNPERTEKDQNAIRKIIREHFPERYSFIPGFNDHPKTQWEDVEMVMEKAAVLREEEGARSDWTLGASES